MGRGPHRALILAALAAAPVTVAAQNPPPAARPDTLAPRLLFNEVFEVGTSIPPRVELSDGVVYRIEVQPGTATLNIRSVRHPSLPPLLMVPLVSAGAATETEAYLIVPRSTDEYRLDVVGGPNEPVRIEIWTDPKEMSRWSRIRTEGFRAPVLALSLRPEVMLPFRDAYGSAQDSAVGYHTAAQGAYGVEACLAVIPNGRVLPDRLGGCAVTFGLWYRGFGRNFYTVGIAPEIVVARRGSGELTLSPQLDFGATRGGRPSAQYVVWGVGGHYIFSPTPNPRFAFDLTATLLNVRSQPEANPLSGEARRVSAFTVALGAGIRFMP